MFVRGTYISSPCCIFQELPIFAIHFMSTDEWFFPVSSVFHSSWACARGTAPTGPTPPGVMSRTPGRFSLWRAAMAVWRPARSWARNKHKQPLRGSSAVALWQRRPSLRGAGGKVMWLGIMVSCKRRDGWLRVHLRPGGVEDVPISFTPRTASMMLAMLAEVCAIPNAGSVKLLADPFCEKHPMCAQALGLCSKTWVESGPVCKFLPLKFRMVLLQWPVWLFREMIICTDPDVSDFLGFTLPKTTSQCPRPAIPATAVQLCLGWALSTHCVCQLQISVTFSEEEGMSRCCCGFNTNVEVWGKVGSQRKSIFGWSIVEEAFELEILIHPLLTTVIQPFTRNKPCHSKDSSGTQPQNTLRFWDVAGFQRSLVLGSQDFRHLHKVFEDELMDARIAAELMGNAPVGLRIHLVG